MSLKQLVRWTLTVTMASASVFISILWASFCMKADNKIQNTLSSAGNLECDRLANLSIAAIKTIGDYAHRRIESMRPVKVEFNLLLEGKVESLKAVSFKYLAYGPITTMYTRFVKDMELIKQLYGVSQSKQLSNKVRESLLNLTGMAKEKVISVYK